MKWPQCTGKTHSGRRLSLVIVVLPLLLTTMPVFSQSGGNYGLVRWTVSGGASNSSGGEFTVSGSAGQAEVGFLLTGGEYTVIGGFLGGGAIPLINDTYLPVVLSSSS